MATYDYECPKDGLVVTINRSISAPEGKYDCLLCNTPLRRIFTAPPVKFKTGGFYSTGG
jgi:putative FmdB family regulatory protein